MADDSTLANDAAEMFGVLSDPLRVRVLLALADSREASWDQEGVSYSDLRERVGAEDGGRFNYHVNELCGQFVEREDGNYWLTLAGSRLVDEVYGGTFSRAHDPREGALDTACPAGGAQLRATVEDGQITVSCPDHGKLITMFLPATIANDRPLERLHELAITHAQRYRESVCEDVCPHCGSRFSEPVVEHTDSMWGSGIELGFECRQCGISFQLNVELFALVQPPVISFFDDHGIDPRSLELYHGDHELTRDARQVGDHFVVVLGVDDARIEVELDRSLTIQSVRRDKITTV
jgi:DNA-binding transcriptional ArsR family regulator